MKLIDTHAHLYFDDFNEDLSQVLNRAKQSGVDRIITVGIDLDTSMQAVSLAEENENIWAAVGIHPQECEGLPADYLDRLKRMAAAPKVVALGEIGLDYYRDVSPREDQVKSFCDQLQLAKELNLPVVLHFRDAYLQGLEILSRVGVSSAGGVMHCYSGGPELLADFLNLGLYISIAGQVTFKKAEDLRQVARDVPQDRLLVETDCPFLSPVPYRGKRNEPSRVKFTAAKIAELRGQELTEAAAYTWENAVRLFRLPD